MCRIRCTFLAVTFVESWTTSLRTRSSSPRREASKFTHALRVGVRNRLQIQIRDTGPGIPEPELRFVFDRFRQGEAGQRSNATGDGLGLSIAQTLSKQLGGELSLASPVSGGTHVTLELPLTAVGETAEGPISTPVIAESRPVLLVEDHEEARHAMGELLTFLGYRVSAVGSGAACRTEIRKFDPDVVIVDLNLPDASGLDLVREFRAKERARGRYWVGVSGMAEASDRRRALEAGFDEYVVKPVSVDQLAPLLQRYCG